MKKFLSYLAFAVVLMTTMVTAQSCSSNDEPDNPSEDVEIVYQEGQKFDYRTYYERLLDSDEWKSYNTGEQRWAAMQIPEQALKDYTTDELIDLCICMPLGIEFICYNNIMDGFVYTFHGFNGYNELLTHKDAAERIVKFYDEVKLALDTKHAVDYPLPTHIGLIDVWIVEVMILSNDFPDIYKGANLITLEKAVNEKIDYKLSHSDIYSSFSLGFLYAIRDRIEQAK